jgi:uncharacterized protein
MSGTEAGVDRLAPGEATLVLVTTTAFATGTALSLTPLQAGLGSLLVFGTLLLVGHALGARLGAALAAFALLLGALVAVAPEGTWPLPAVVAVAVAAMLSRRRSSWLARGRPDRLAWLLTGVTALVAPAALVVWFVTLGDPSGSVRAGVALLRELPSWSLPLVGLAFALGNAFAEEAIYRGILQTALARVVGPVSAIPLQGLAFGAAHLHGFPSGPAGVALAAVYGTALGVIRWRSGGLLAPWLTHVVADLVIFAIVVGFLL